MKWMMKWMMNKKYKMKQNKFCVSNSPNKLVVFDKIEFLLILFLFLHDETKSNGHNCVIYEKAYSESCNLKII